MLIVGPLIAQVVFWVVLVLGYRNGVPGPRGAAIFAGLWVAGYFVLPRIAWWTSGLITPWIAVLDIALIFVVRRGDLFF